MVYKVFQFKTARGDKPVENFIREMPRAVQARTWRMIELLEEKGPILGMPYSKKISQDLYELRLTGRMAVRIFYTVKKVEITLLHVFQKKTQKTPRKEIKLAQNRLALI